MHNYRPPLTIPPNYIRVRAVVWKCGKEQTETDTQADRETTVTNVHFASATPNAKCNQRAELNKVLDYIGSVQGLGYHRHGGGYGQPGTQRCTFPCVDQSQLTGIRYMSTVSSSLRSLAGLYGSFNCSSSRVAAAAASRHGSDDKGAT